MLEQVRDETADFLRVLQFEHENPVKGNTMQRTVTIDLNRSCGEAETNINVRV
jgi:hypothetical protein